MVVRRRSRAGGTGRVDVELMQETRDYSEVDYKAMLEIMSYLRREH